MAVEVSGGRVSSVRRLEGVQGVQGVFGVFCVPFLRSSARFSLSDTQRLNSRREAR